jgi:hypothetical protein
MSSSPNTAKKKSVAFLYASHELAERNQENNPIHNTSRKVKLNKNSKNKPNQEGKRPLQQNKTLKKV